MKTNELQAGKVYSYGTSTNRIATRAPVIPLITDTYLQVANDRDLRAGKPYLFEQTRQAFSNGDPHRGVLSLVANNTSDGALQELQDKSTALLSLPEPDVALPPHYGAMLTPAVRWLVLNPAWIREPWDEHLERLEQIAQNQAIATEVMRQQAAARTSNSARLRQLLRAKGVHIAVDNHADHQAVPTTTLIALLERVQ